MLIEETLRAIPTHIGSLFDAGIIGYTICKMQNSGKKTDGQKHSPAETVNWQNYLKHFLELAPNHQNVWIARQVLEGKGLPSEKKQPFVQKENGTGPNR